MLNDETSYQETSAAAGIAAALVSYAHPLHQNAIANAYNGIIANMDEDGSVRNVSAGTAVMHSAEDYKVISKKCVLGWCQGLTLAFLVALLQNREIVSKI